MMRKPLYILALLAGLCVVVLLGALKTAPAQAQSETPVGESACRACHEDQYYLYDTGKWFCLCGRQRACKDCHAGNPDTYDLTLAHEGLVANPIADNPAVCQECHPDDYQAYIEKFAAIAGIDPHHPEPGKTPIFPASAVKSEEETLPSGLQLTSLKPWQVAVLSVLGVVFLGIIVFGYRCWKADCIAKAMKS